MEGVAPLPAFWSFSGLPVSQQAAADSVPLFVRCSLSVYLGKMCLPPKNSPSLPSTPEPPQSRVLLARAGGLGRFSQPASASLLRLAFSLRTMFGKKKKSWNISIYLPYKSVDRSLLGLSKPLAGISHFSSCTSNILKDGSDDLAVSGLSGCGSHPSRPCRGTMWCGRLALRGRPSRCLRGVPPSPLPQLFNRFS